MVRDALVRSGVGLSAGTLDALVDAIVQATLSHLVQPRQAPERVADGLVGITAAVPAAHGR